MADMRGFSAANAYNGYIPFYSDVPVQVCLLEGTDYVTLPNHPLYSGLFCDVVIAHTGSKTPQETVPRRVSVAIATG